MDLLERVLEHADTAALEEIIRTAITEQMRQAWTVMPVSLSEDSDGKTVKVKASIKAQERDESGKLKQVELPEMPEVPINFTAGGKMTDTYPLKSGDEGLNLFASRAAAAWRQSGGVQQAVDTRSHHLADGFFVPGIKPKPKDLKDINTEARETRSDDGKQRLINHPANGTKVSNNGGKQVLDVNATSGAIQAYSKTVTLAAGDVAGGAPQNAADTINRELNNQLKGLRAEMTQVKDSHHALFDVVSKLRKNVESVVPALSPVNLASQVTSALSGNPAGLDAMKALASGQLQSYFQTSIQAALQDFLNPARMLAAGSLLSGGIEGLMKALTAQIAQLVAQNPVIGQVQDLQRQIDGILARGANPVVQDAAIAPIQAEIDALTKGNPVVGQALDLAKQLQGLAAQAGPGLDFLAPQQRLAQGQIKSVHFSE